MADTGSFGQQAAHQDRWASFCDADSAGHLDPGPAVQALAQPLAEQGIPVSGIDASPDDDRDPAPAAR